MTGLSGSIRSPDVDKTGEYDPIVYCEWTIFADENKIIELHFHETGTQYTAECTSDYIEVRLYIF